MSALANPLSVHRPICILLGGLAAVRCEQKPKPVVCALFLSPRQLAANEDASPVDSVSAFQHTKVTRHG